MRDKSKRLTVINTGKRDSSEKSQVPATPVKGGNGGVSVNMSDYLLKSVWAKAWDIRVDSSGNEYVFGKLPVLLQYGLTMYADSDHVSVPSLFDGIPIDNNTIYWDETTNADGSVTRVLKAKGVGGEGGSADFGNVLESGTGNAFTSFSISDDGKELTLVKGETFVKQSDFNALSEKLTDFLEGSDTDNIINKWKELEAFLGGMSESSDLANILSGKAEKATTLSGYGITNAYTKTETDDLLDEKADWGTTLSHYGITNAYTKTEVTNLLGDYLPLTGGTITGNLRLRTGSEYTSPYLYFGDSDEVYLKEATDQYLTIHADKGIVLDSPLTTIDGIEIKKSAEGVLYIGANLVVSGGITMYGTDGTTSSSIWDGAPIASTSVKGIASFDSEFFAVSNGKVTFIGETGGGGIESITKQMVIDALGYTPYNSTNPNGYVTSSGSVNYASSSGSCTGNADTATSLETSRTLWGQSFDGSGNVSGDLSGVGDIDANYWSITEVTSSRVQILLPGQYIQTGSDGALYLGTDTSKGLKITSSGSVTTMNGIYSSNFYAGETSYGMGTFTNGLQLETYSLFRINQNGTVRMYMDASGNFGIKTSSPSSALHVAGSVQANNKFILTSKDTGDATLGYTQGGTMILRHNTSGQTVLSGSGGTLYFRPNGTSSDSGQCTISTGGNLLVPGGVTMYSDERKKTILNHVELSLKEVAEAPLIEHYYNSDEKKTTHVGSIAQYWAGLNDWFCKKDDKGFYMMEIQNAALASAISVAREVVRLKEHIRELESEIEKLKTA